MNEIINLTATNASLTLPDPTALPILTSGMRNHVLCKFSCSDAWNTLSKVATFRAGDQHVSVLPEDWIDEDTVAVPAKVLAASGYLVHVGLYGFSGAPENIIIPTVEANIGIVRTGSDPAGDTPGEDATPLWVQIKAEIGSLDHLATEDKQNLVAAINEAYNHGGGSGVESVNGKTGPDVELLGTDIKTYDGAAENVTAVAMSAASNAGTALAAISITDAKIPPQASTSNQLADKDFVNSSINNIAAFYITKNAAGDPFSTKAELTAATVFYSGGVIREPTRNDYTIVLADESKADAETGEAPTTRYSYDNGWNYQYIVNNSGLTAAQLAAIESGITAEKVAEISDKLPLSAGSDHPLTGDLYMAVGAGKKIRRLGDPIAEYDAANKRYVDKSIEDALGDIETLLADI